jgi:signal transduction histidine kinase
VQRLLDPAGRPAGSPSIAGAARRLLFDRSGALWLATTHGVVRADIGDPSGPPAAPRPDPETFSSAEGLSGTDVFDLFLDRESNIWAATSGGLDLFRETALVAAPFPPRMHAIRLAPGRDGAVWAGSRNHPLLQLSNGVVTATNVPPPVTAVYSDRTGTVWAWGAGQLWRSAGGRFNPLAPPPAGVTGDAVSLSGDHLGRVWVSFLNGPLYIYGPDGWSTPWVRGLPMMTARVRVTLAEAGGRVWLGYDDSRVVAILGDRVDTFSPERGLRVGAVSAIAGSSERLWVGGTLGTAVIENGRVHMVTGLDQAAIGTVKGLVESADGSLWLNAARGIVLVPAAEIRQTLRDRSHPPQFRVFDYLDGVIGGAAPIPPQAAISGSDGRVWFVGFDNVVSLAPGGITSNPVPPPVHIQSLRAGSTEYEAGAPVRLPVGTSQVELTYTALSLAIPSRVRFRVRLDGLDRSWQDAGRRREAFYTNLGPGSYTFRVMAANNDGIWNEAGARLVFVIPPAFHQTAAFRGGALLAGVGLVWGWYRWRLRQVTAQVRANLAERLGERERIARELHDTLLQGLQGLILKFQSVAARLPPGDRAAVMMEQTLEQADRVLVESRDRVRDLRASVSPGLSLSRALEQAGTDLITAAVPVFQVVVHGDERPLDPIVCDEAYWIGREALLNAAQHAQPTHIEVEVRYDPSELRVRCRDNGNGFEPARLETIDDAGRWGVRGMKERARQMGAELEIWTRPGLGTIVDLRVPAGTAYRPAARSWLGWMRRGAAAR